MEETAFHAAIVRLIQAYHPTAIHLHTCETKTKRVNSTATTTRGNYFPRSAVRRAGLAGVLRLFVLFVERSESGISPPTLTSLSTISTL